MTLLQAVVLGLVQGLSEFLPVSSNAHLRIVPAIFGWHFYHGTTNDPGAPFTAIVQLGTALALAAYFWRELLHVSVAWIRGLFDATVRTSLEYRMGWYLIAATIPVGVLGLIFHHRIDVAARNLWLLASTLIGFALLLFAAERVGTKRREEEELNRTDALVVAVAATVALVPGASRSGTTITGGLFRGLTREAAARFAFLLAVPAVVLSGVVQAARIGSKHDASPGSGLIGIAVVVAFVAGLAAIHGLMRWLGGHSTVVFVYYRVGLGLLIIGLLAGGVLKATR